MTFAPKRLSDHVQAVLDALMAAEGHMTVAQLQKATGQDESRFLDTTGGERALPDATAPGAHNPFGLGGRVHRLQG